MKNTYMYLLLLLLFSHVSFKSIADATILNRNFESDVIPLETGYTTHISGWVKNGSGVIGINAPLGSNIHYQSVANQVQVAYLEEGGRIAQATDLILSEGHLYTLTFDAGQRLDQLGVNFVARVKVDGLILAQVHSSELALQAGVWSTKTLDFTATRDMPIGKSVVVEFQNLANAAGYQANIDNVYLTNVPANIELAQQTNLVLIHDNMTLEVPFDFYNIESALQWLKDKRLKNGVDVTVQVSDCKNEHYDSPLVIEHPNASSIEIIGNILNPEQCVIEFPNSDGIKIVNGTVLSNLSGFAIHGNNLVETSGMHVLDGSGVNAGGNINIQYFDVGLRAENNARVFLENLQMENNLIVGAYSLGGSFVELSNSISNSNGKGYFAENGGSINVNNGMAMGNEGGGYYAFNSGYIRADGGSEANANTGYGFSARQNSFINGSSSRSLYNSSHEYFAGELSFVLDGNYTSWSGTTYPKHREISWNNGYVY